MSEASLQSLGSEMCAPVETSGLPGVILAAMAGERWDSKSSEASRHRFRAVSADRNPV
jgi:hypothetical protein